MYIHTHKCLEQQLMNNEAINLKEIKEKYMGELAEKRRKGEMV